MPKKMTSDNRTKNKLEEVSKCNVVINVASPWLTANQAKAYLQIREETLRELLNRGEIKSVRRGKTRFVHTSWLDEWMMKQPSGAMVPAALVAKPM